MERVILGDFESDSFSFLLVDGQGSSESRLGSEAGDVTQANFRFHLFFHRFVFAWDFLLVGISCSPSKRNIIIEHEIAHKSNQRHIRVEHHPVDLLALLQT